LLVSSGQIILLLEIYFHSADSSRLDNLRVLWCPDLTLFCYTVVKT